MKHPGKVAYQIYGLTVGNVNFQGKPMPKWDDLPPVIQSAWVEVAYQMREQSDEQIEAWLKTTEEVTGAARLE